MVYSNNGSSPLYKEGCNSNGNQPCSAFHLKAPESSQAEIGDELPILPGTGIGSLME